MNRKLVIASGCLILLLLIVGTAKAQAPVANFKGDATSGCGPLSIRFTDLSTNAPLFWSWDFGNGQTSNQQNPLVTYANPGTYTVTLTVRNKDGVDTKQLVNYITVFVYPHANYTNSLDLACLPANVQFTDMSTPAGGITSWNWDFGDGSTSTLQSPSHTYTTTGYFNVSLTVSNPGGCTNKHATIRTVRVVDGVQPNFTFDQVSASCLAPYTVNFLNQTAGPGTLTYNWSLGSGASPASSSAQNPTGVAYPASVNYTVTLDVQSSYGCGASIQKTLPFGSFAAKINGPDTVCINTPATFSNGSTPPNPAGMTWKFGDGTTANSNPIGKTYKAVGFYPLTLVNRYNGCIDSVTKTIQVASQPIPDFTATPTSACKPNLTVNFTDATTVGIPVQWNWNFGDGSSSTQRNPQHIYTQFGAFDVTLTVTGAGGCSDLITKKAFVNIQAPTVTIDDANNLGACVNGGPGDKISVSPTAKINSVDPPTGYTYSWSAPGSIEGSSTSSNPSFHYTTQSTYNITVTVTSPNGCQATSPPATVQIGTPLTGITYSPDKNPVCGRDTVTFTASMPPLADHYRWDFGDLTNSGALNLRVIKHSYDTFGTFATYLTVVNHGCPYTSSSPFSITVNPPIPRFGFKVNCPNNVNFLDSSLIDNTLPVTYLWDFGDTTATSNLQNPPHTYTNYGLHHVTLTVSNGSCPPQSYTRDIFLGQIAVAAMPATDTVCTGINFAVTDASVITPTPYPDNYISAYLWKLDTFPTVTQTNPVFTYYLLHPGIVNLTLQVRDTNGCVYPLAGPTRVATITITAPTANFTFSPSPGQCKNSPVTFTDHSTPDPNSNSPIQSWTYNFGDSTTGTTQNPTHPYADTGYFHVSLRVTDAQGCTATYTAPDSIQVTSPYAAFSGPDSFYCPGVPIQFIDSSFGYNITENWDFGDGTIVSGLVPPHTYATPGTKYSAVLTVKDKYNCVNTYTRLIDIEKPVAAFDIADTFSICIPLQTQFTARTQFIDSLYWSFGDGTTSTLPITSHFYNSYNNFTAKLFAFGPGGCFDTASRLVRIVNPIPATSMTYSPLSACDSVPVQFDITVPPYTSFILVYDDLVIDSSQNLHPFHMYRNPNPYQPRLGLTDPTGCFVNVNGKNGLITVLGATPFFSIDRHKFCDSSMVTFLDYTFSNNGIDSETYVFGDGSPSQTLSPGTGSFNVQNFFTKIGAWPVSLKVSTDSGCHETYNDTVFVYQTPHPVITLNSNPCAGIVQFQGSLTQPEVDTIKWDWNFGNGQTSGNQNPAVKMNPGNYTVTLIASVSLGCTDTTSDNLTIHPIPLVSGPKEITTPLGIPVTIPFTYSAGVTTYQWSPATNLDCPTCPDPVATLLLSTQYSVTVADSSGCKATDSIFIKTICNTDNLFMPNTFSPNGDGVNDVFYPRGKSLYNVQSLQVFNRWGQMVFQRRDFPANTESMGWDGRINGKPASPDAYVYIVEVICENAQVVAIHGTVTLIR